MSLELANAMIYSGATGEAVSLPLDREAYSDCWRGCRGRMRRAYTGLTADLYL